MIRTIALMSVLFLSFNSFAQTTLDEINLELIPQKKIRTYITEQNKVVQNIMDIKPSCKGNQDLSEYSSQTKNYKIKEKFPVVWAQYIKTSPAESWEGHRISFGVLVSKPKDKIIYSGQQFSEIDTGQVIFLDLKILKGIYHLALAIEIITIDPIRKIIEFSYIEGNKSQGLQRLQFVDVPNGNTQIIHTSFFKSDSKFRDKVLYPFFHKKATNEFHKNLKKIIVANNKSEQYDLENLSAEILVN